MKKMDVKISLCMASVIVKLRIKFQKKLCFKKKRINKMNLCFSEKCGSCCVDSKVKLLLVGSFSAFRLVLNLDKLTLNNWPLDVCCS